MAELQKAATTLETLRGELGITYVAIDSTTNEIVVQVKSGYSASKPAGLVGVNVRAENGDTFRTTSCWDTCSPWRGGMHIWNPQFVLDGHCTWGFYGTRGAAAKYVMTAGHCGKFTHKEQLPGFNNLVFTDAIDRNTFDENDISQSDAQTAHVKGNPNATSPFNRIIASSSDLSHSITSVRSNSQPIGSMVCFFGITTHYASPCGVIQLVSVSADATREDGKLLHLTNLIIMSKAADHGDSGGPIYSGSVAYGIVTGDTGGHMIYSTAANVQLNTGTNICVSSAC